MRRDDLVQLLLVAVTASGVGAGMAALFNSGFKSDDVFAFGGAIVGAAGTVAGAAWVADRAATKEKRAEQSVVREELVTLLDLSQSAAAAFPNEGAWTENWRSSVHALGDVATGTDRFLDEVIAYAKTLDFHQREAIKGVRSGVAYFVSFYDDVFGPNEIDPTDERDWPGTINVVVQAVTEALATFRRP